MNPLTVAIRANGGDVIGLGHIRRCLSLAQTLSGQGAQVLFVTNPDNVTLDLVAENGFKKASVDLAHDFEQTCAAIDHWRAAVLVVDSYDIKADYLTRIREHVRLVVAIDDLGDENRPVDLVVNGGASAAALSYSALPSTRFLLGPRYVMLREEFAQEPVREHQPRIGRVLITVGGSDPTNLTSLLIEQTLRFGRASIDVAGGPFFHNQAEIEEAAAQSPDRVTVYHSPGDMRSLMLEADLAISGGGQTTYELAATATPAVAICRAENQRGNLAGLEHEGTLINIGDALARDLPEKLAGVLKELDSDVNLRRQMGMRGRQVVDGLGTQRVARAIAEEYERRSKPDTSSN